MSQSQPERTTTGVIIEELAKPFKDQSPLAFLVHAREIREASAPIHPAKPSEWMRLPSFVVRGTAFARCRESSVAE